MQHPGFFEKAGPFSVPEIAAAVGAEVADASAAATVMVEGIRALADAGPAEMTFVDNRKYLPQLAGTRASACLVAPQFAARVPAGVLAMVTPQPYHAFARALLKFYPDSVWSKAATGTSGAAVDPSAVLEEGAIIEPGAIVGPEAMIGSGSRIAAGAVIGYRVAIGRGTYVGANASVIHALVGDRVIIHPGVRIGQDGFGFALGKAGHLKVPQIGRVIIQDGAEIGANTTIDRGALRDTIIGEGSKIDNLVQIGHNVVMGRHAVIVGQTGISGSAELGDFVIMGGQSGLVGHVKVGAGCQIAGASHVKDDLPAGSIVGGTPAKPFKQWARELAALTRLGERRVKDED